MKNLRDVKNEYGYVLRWINGGGDESGDTWDYTFYLENINTQERIDIKNEKALEFISKKTTNAFRNDFNIYNNYVELFKILNIGGKNE